LPTCAGSQDAVGLTRSIEAKLSGMSSQVELTLKRCARSAASANAQIKPMGSAIDETRSPSERHAASIPFAGDLHDARPSCGHVQQSEKTCNISSMTAENASCATSRIVFTELSAAADPCGP